ncbi:DUF1440 domain-containing protein [Micromonospora deserti]|uniref:DUF1440 domain-containing protein n=1 Tax=Micromonospora deserti TaxID=2070366 RepID=A0A2W2CT99_9ACTN|nr:DUF1440 domain-containing protein [Micromonospora deserti]PZF88376.1 DUF1440 domain-containing protein [Micromonospora deserti]
MTARALVADGALSAVAGIIATRAMDPVTTKIYEAQSDDAKQQEQKVSYGVAYNVAARKIAGVLGVQVSDETVSKAGTAMHYALGIAAAPAYMLLRRATRLSPWGAGLATAIGLYAVLDEALNPLLGFTPPPQAYPPVAHLRGLAGHLVLGLVVAATVETGWALLRRRP